MQEVTVIWNVNLLINAIFQSCEDKATNPPVICPLLTSVLVLPKPVLMNSISLSLGPTKT